MNDLEIVKRMILLRQKYVMMTGSINSGVKTVVKDVKNNENIDFEPKISNNTVFELTNKLKIIQKDLVNKILDELKDFYKEDEKLCMVENKKIKRFSKKIISVLEESFSRDRYPSETEKVRIAELCLISLKQVNNWFTNKRNRTKHLYPEHLN
ncbi:HD-1 [Ecytonucleospora hepatopenaei]|uniref:HD-1 n=1 Tax=Ecytonucleospora hepatopenaei TaxID=646526 RepID=A0A1W0E2N8_9MICR|nr:hypothetical protein EHP00_2656 [Ecytonucleospora hepatopenaei]OQS53498.1 HD-1 [Ecytonucleospora hepatopenaei]